MAISGRTYRTLLDVAKSTNPDGSHAKIAELLTISNTMLEDLAYVEANGILSHRSTMRTGLPASQTRRINQGVLPGNSDKEQQTDVLAEILQYAETDVSLVNGHKDPAAFRFDEDKPQIMAMAQNIQRMAVYGNTVTAPDEFLGMAPRYGQIAGARNARNIFDAGGVGSNNTSIWFVVPDPQVVHFIYNPNDIAGINQMDKGIQTVFPSGQGGAQFEAYQSVYKWTGGMVLRDWRYVVRVCNLDVTALTNAGQAGYTGPDLLNIMVDAFNRIENMMYGAPVIYVNRTVLTAVDKLATARQNNAFRPGEWFGQPVTFFRNCPVRLCDSILSTESRIV
jgi:hypothetical protein